MKLKIAFIGAGSMYCQSVAGELAITPQLTGSSLVLYDVEPKRMELMKRVAQRMFAKTGMKVKVSATLDLAEALDGADFVISSVGVHGPGARWHMTDVNTCARFGIMHTTGDTVGPAGLSQGLRIVPVYMHLASQMEKYCPQAVLLNHSNPMAVICRALWKYTKVNVIGYCHTIGGEVEWYAQVLGVPAKELQAVATGPNHCSWLLKLTHKGKDVYPELKKRVLNSPDQKTHTFQKEVLRLLDIMPMGGDRHIVEFFPHSRQATSEETLRYDMQWRTRMIEQNQLARELNKQPDTVELRAKGKLPVELPTEPSPESMGQQIVAMSQGPEIYHPVNTPNRGAVSNLPDWAVIDTYSVVAAGGARPVQVGEIPPQAARWSLAQIYTHELTVDAAVEGSRSKALQALANDPMIVSFSEVEPLFDALVEAQGDRLKRFRKKR